LALQDLTFEILENFLISLLQSGKKNGQGLSHSSVRKVSLALSEGLNYAVQCKKIALNPMNQVDTPKGFTKLVVFKSLNPFKTFEFPFKLSARPKGFEPLTF
jgi:hypothetical protein